MGNTLIFYFYANNNTIDSEVNKLHFKCLKTFKNCFKQVSIYIALDDINDTNLLTKARRYFLNIFGGMDIFFSLIPFKHDEHYVLSKFFKDEIVDNIHKYEYLYFANNLISTKNADYNNVFKLITMMYYYNLNSFEEIKNKFWDSINNITCGAYLFNSDIGRNIAEFFYEENCFWLNCPSIYSLINSNYLEEKIEPINSQYYINDFLTTLKNHGGICLSVNDLFYSIGHDIDRTENITEISESLQYLTEGYNKFINNMEIL